jgi:L-ascorbate metabolism protein UlaG (beta-lactamase superfamily)
VLTDPWFSERFGYYHGEPYGIRLSALPRLAGVLVSHDHYDHYDIGAFQAYPDKQVPIVVKRGDEKKAHRVGFANVIGMEAWESTTFGPITVTAASGKHGVPEITYLLQAGASLSTLVGIPCSSRNSARSPGVLDTSICGNSFWGSGGSSGRRVGGL